MRNYLIPVLFLLIILNVLPASGETGPVLDPFEIIGMDISSALESFGDPDEVFPLRGEEAWQDDVVFFYRGRLYLYWYENRVWQVRYDENTGFSWRGIRPGLSSREISAIIGRQPDFTGDDWEIYFLSELPFPLRLRIFYTEKGAMDFYLYRGDF